MQDLLTKIESPHRKTKTADIRPGDTVRVHQVIREGNKKRTQIFEGVVIRYNRKNELSARILVRKVASGVGVEKSLLVHSPNVVKIEVVKRTKVRRAYLTYLRQRHGKSARLAELGFNKDAVNMADDRTAAQVAQESKAESKNESDGIESVEVVESTDDLAKEEEKEA